MIEQIIDPPNLGFRTLVVIYLKSILAIFQKNHLHASETGKIWKQTKVVKITKKYIFKQFFFLYDGANNRPPHLNFWTLAVISIYFCNFSEKSVACTWNWKDLEANKSSENNKKIFLNHFFYIMEQIIEPQHKFLNFCCNLLSNDYCKFSKK